MSAIVPLSGGTLPAYLQNRAALATVNDEAITGGNNFGIMSIKGKVFTLVKGKEKKILTRPDDPEEVLQSINLSIARANPKARVFYIQGYTEGSEGADARPDCHSNDGVSPAADSKAKQSSTCATCKHAVWGSKVNREGGESKGTACTPNTRLAVMDPDVITKPGDEPEALLLRVPAGSRTNFNEVVKKADARGIPYNALVLKVGFDKEAPSPKLTFKIVGLLDDETYAVMAGLREHELVKDIVGLGPVRAALPAPEPAPAPSEVDEDLDAAIAAKAPKPAPKAAPKPDPVQEVADELGALDAKPEPAAKPAKKAPAAAPKEVKTVESENLLEGLDDILGSQDD